MMQKGHTLIEVMVTLVVIAIGVLAIIRFQSYLSYDSSLIVQKMDATILANKQIDTLRDFQVLNNTSGYTSYQSIASGSSNTTLGNTAYTTTWTITTYSNPNYKRIDVTVSWTDRYSIAQSVRFVSYTAGIDPGNSATVM